MANTKKDSIKIYERQPKQTKRAIESAHLITTLIFEYFNANPCKDSKNIAESILDSIFIAGGACRDYVKFDPINDVDLKINMLKIRQIMLNHLNKYHKTMKQQQSVSHCVLWRLYLNKFESDQNVNKLCNGYIINANFIVKKILSKSPKLIHVSEFKEKTGTSGTYFTMKITKDCMYKDLNLKESEFDIANFEAQKGILFGEEERKEDEKEKEEMDRLNCNVVEIEMPYIYDFFKLYLPDLSINSLLLPLSHFIKSSVVDYRLWTNSFVKSYNCVKYNCLNDFEKKQLTAPNFDEIVTRQHPHVHWWRLIKFLIRYYDQNWKLPDENVQIHKKHYPEWLCDNYFTENENFVYFTKKQFKKKYGLAKTYEEFEIMLKIIDEVFECNKKIVSIINGNKQFKKYWVYEGLDQLCVEYPDTIDEIQQNKIKQLFKKYGYPTL